MVAEAWVMPSDRLAAYIRQDEMHQAFNFDYLKADWDAQTLREVIDDSLAASALVGAPTTWVLSNHDVVRHPSRYGLPAGTPWRHGLGVGDPQPDEAMGLQRARAATLLMLALPGSAYLYQGEELGLPEHTTLPDDARQDPTWARSGHTNRGRDGCRVPVPWSRPRARSVVRVQRRCGHLAAPAGVVRALRARRPARGGGIDLQLYRAGLRLRREHGLGTGELTWVGGAAPGLLTAANGGVLVIANLGSEPAALPEGAELLVASGSSPWTAGCRSTPAPGCVPSRAGRRAPGRDRGWCSAATRDRPGAPRPAPGGRGSRGRRRRRPRRRRHRAGSAARGPRRPPAPA